MNNLSSSSVGPIKFDMTLSAKASEIGQAVGLLISLKTKFSKRNLVGNGEFFAQLVLMNTAMLTGMVISVTSFIFLVAPVWAIVALLSTLPVRAIFSLECLRKPNVSTAIIAKIKPLIFYSSGCSFDGCAASIAFNEVSAPLAFFGAMYSVFGLGWWQGKFLSTTSAVFCYPLLHPCLAGAFFGAINLFGGDPSNEITLANRAYPNLSQCLVLANGRAILGFNLLSIGSIPWIAGKYFVAM